MNSEIRIWRELLSALGINQGKKPKGEKYSQYYGPDGKLLTQKEIHNREIVYDKEGNDLPAPRNRGLVDLIPTSPLDLAFETGMSGIMEASYESPEVGVLGCLAGAYLLSRGKTPSNKYPKLPTETVNIYGSGGDILSQVTKKLPNVTEMIMGDGTVIQKNPAVVNRVIKKGLLKNSESAINFAKRFKDLDKANQDLLKKKIGTSYRDKDAPVKIYQDGDVREIPLQAFQEIMTRMNPNIPWLQHVNPVKASYVDDFGHLRWKGQSTPLQYADMDIKMSDLDFPGKQHAKSSVSIQNLAHALEIARKAGMDDPTRVIRGGITPGGVRLFETGRAGENLRKSWKSTEDYAQWLLDTQADPNYVNYQLQKHYEETRQLWNEWVSGKPKGTELPTSWQLSDMIEDRNWSQQFPIWKGYPHHLQRLSKLTDNPLPPTFGSMTHNAFKSSLPNSTNAYEFLEYMNSAKRPLQSAVRLDIKPHRLDEWVKRKKQGLGPESGLLTMSKDAPPFIFEDLGLISGKIGDEALRPLLANNMHRYLTRSLRRGRGVEDPNTGFGLDFQEWFSNTQMKHLSNKDQLAFAQKFQLGLLPLPALYSKDFRNLD